MHSKNLETIKGLVLNVWSGSEKVLHPAIISFSPTCYWDAHPTYNHQRDRCVCLIRVGSSIHATPSAPFSESPEMALNTPEHQLQDIKRIQNSKWQGGLLQDGTGLADKLSSIPPLHRPRVQIQYELPSQDLGPQGAVACLLTYTPVLLIQQHKKAFSDSSVLFLMSHFIVPVQRYWCIITWIYVKLITRHCVSDYVILYWFMYVIFGITQNLRVPPCQMNEPHPLKRHR